MYEWCCIDNVKAFLVERFCVRGTRLANKLMSNLSFECIRKVSVKRHLGIVVVFVVMWNDDMLTHKTGNNSRITNILTIDQWECIFYN